MGNTYRADITADIIRMVEEGTAPWQKPWRCGERAGRPHNAITGRFYTGGNRMVLSIAQDMIGSNDPRWATFKQAQAAGWQIKKGSKSRMIEFWQFHKEEKDEEGKKVWVDLPRPRVFFAFVFHASQIEGIPEFDSGSECVPAWDVEKEAERIIAASGARIVFGGDRACYNPITDQIRMPDRRAFPNGPAFYATMMHELGHWTGHPSRLNRDLSGGFGSEDYAREELRAEMASLFLSYEMGLPFDPAPHASYASSWLEVLRKDKDAFFQACRDAERIADYLLALGRKESQTPMLELLDEAA